MCIFPIDFHRILKLTTIPAYNAMSGGIFSTDVIYIVCCVPCLMPLFCLPFTIYKPKTHFVFRRLSHHSFIRLVLMKHIFFCYSHELGFEGTRCKPPKQQDVALSASVRGDCDCDRRIKELFL